MSKTAIGLLLAGVVVLLAGMMFLQAKPMLPNQGQDLTPQDYNRALQEGMLRGVTQSQEREEKTIRFANGKMESPFNHKVILEGLDSLDSVAERAVDLTKHFVEQSPEKPKTNKDLMDLYVKTYGDFAKAIKAAK